MNRRRQETKEEEDEPLFMDSGKRYVSEGLSITYFYRPKHKITRKEHKGSTGFLAYLPRSAKYIFLIMMAMGVICMAYVMFFGGKNAQKFQNKGKLNTFLKSEFKILYYQNSKFGVLHCLSNLYIWYIANKIETYNITEISPNEFFSVFIPNGVPAFLDMESNYNGSSESKDQIHKVYERLEEKILGSSVEATLIPWYQKRKDEHFEHEVKYIDIEELKEEESCYYINEHALRPADYNTFRDYLYERANYIKYLPLLDEKIKVLGKCTPTFT